MDDTNLGQHLLDKACAAWRDAIWNLHPERLLVTLSANSAHEITFAEKPLFQAARPIKVLALGKTAAALGRAAATRLGNSFGEGLVVQGQPVQLGERWTTLVGGHPRTNAQSVEAGRAVVTWLESLNADDRLLVLMSGGASAMMEQHAPGWDLERSAAGRLADLEAGLPIAEVNHRASSRSLIKDGGLAGICPCPWRQLTVNDVIDGADGLVSSGPFLGLEGNDIQLANHQHAAQACASDLKAQGWQVRRGDSLCGEARLVGAELPRLRPGQALVLSGETSVEGPYLGQGGRNLELVGGWLLNAKRSQPWALVSGASDGLDGTSGAAGAAVCSGAAFSLEELRTALGRHATAPWFERHQALLPKHDPICHVGDLLVLLQG